MIKRYKQTEIEKLAEILKNDKKFIFYVKTRKFFPS